MQYDHIHWTPQWRKELIYEKITIERCMLFNSCPLLTKMYQSIGLRNAHPPYQPNVKLFDLIAK